MAHKDRLSSFEEFDAKLEKLSARGSSPRGERRWGGRALSQGMQAGIDILVGLVGGVLIGFGLDDWFGTRPLFLIVFFVFGSAAGIRNALRDLRRAGSPEAGTPPEDAETRSKGEDGE